MPRPSLDTDNHIGRRIKLRDLQIFSSVAAHGSMAKAAAHLAVTQPTVSQAIADLEAAVEVRLFDRSTKGVVLTAFGELLLESGARAFDALKQGMRGIEYLATPGAGDVRIGCIESTLHGLIPAIVQRLAKTHPKIVVHAAHVNPSEGERLRDRQLDLLVGRWPQLHTEEDVHVETLLEDSFTVAASTQNPWAKRRKVALGDLMDEPWIFGEAGNATQERISAVFQAKCGRLPRIAVYTTAMNLRLALLNSGNSLSCIPTAGFRYGAQGLALKALPIDMGLTLPIALISVKNRTLSAVAQQFIDCARVVAKEMANEV